MRRQFYLSGLLSLTMLLSEQVNRIALKTSEPISAEDSTYTRLILTLLEQFVERTSSTALIAAEKAGLVSNIIKMLKVSDKDFLCDESRATIV